MMGDTAIGHLFVKFADGNVNSEEVCDTVVAQCNAHSPTPMASGSLLQSELQQFYGCDTHAAGHEFEKQCWADKVSVAAAEAQQRQ